MEEALAWRDVISSLSCCLLVLLLSGTQGALVKHEGFKHMPTRQDPPPRTHVFLGSSYKQMIFTKRTCDLLYLFDDALFVSVLYYTLDPCQAATEGGNNVKDNYDF